MPAWTLTARWILPLNRPPLEDGTITVDGDRIVMVDSHGCRWADIDAGDALILPG